MIKTVIFDLGRVLVDFDFTRGYSAMSEASGLEAGEVRARLKESGLVPAFESGRIGEQEFESKTQALLGTSITSARFREIWYSIFLPGTLIEEEMVASIRSQRRTVLLSNTNPLHFAGLKDNYTILDHFDAYVLSHEVKAMKPEPEIYAAAIRAAGCEPGECFFTDDIEEYVEGARRAGIDAVQFKDSAQIRGELRARGVDC